MALSGQKVPLNTFLLAAAVDALSIMVWQKTNDGQKGKNKPKSIVDSLTRDKRESEIVAFDTGEEFEKVRRELLNGIGGEE